ncbi:hypothetical protein E2C01_042172 [Portunus trituberculatus]|uniref:Uncharacterized protein n=1 Tax=Portunus trituberculatus TaxID=210409 RepID=A0A5B7FL25_PORTR|nr:hypothetical protein [Portunus trituberculatus]
MEYSFLGLNVAGLQSLTTNIGGLQNVQVTIPGLAVPISLSLNVPVSSSTGVILSSPPPASCFLCRFLRVFMAEDLYGQHARPEQPTAAQESGLLMDVAASTPGS